MSHQLARRTGTVGALVAAASMTMVAGVWPAVGMASAADAPPAQVEQDGASGTDTAPGQVDKDAEPVVGPAAGPVAEAPQADAPAKVTKEDGAPARGQAEKDAPVEEPAPAVGPATGVKKNIERAVKGARAAKEEKASAKEEKALAKEEKASAKEEKASAKEERPVKEEKVSVKEEKAPVNEERPVKEEKAPVNEEHPLKEEKASAKEERPVKEEKASKPVGPPTGIEPEEKAAPVADHGPRKAGVPSAGAPVQGPAPVEQPRKEIRVPVGPATGLAPAPKKTPRVGPAAPKAAAPAAEQSRAAAPTKVGPAVAVAPVVPVRTSTPAAGVTTATASAPVDRRTLPAGSTGLRPSSRHSQVSAADPLPLRPIGSEVIVLPEPARMEIVEVDLAHALPRLAAGTVEAVARTPQLPLGIAAVVVLFLLVQGRIDRRDPKLAEDPVEDNQPLEFFPAQVHLRLVTAA